MTDTVYSSCDDFRGGRAQLHVKGLTLKAFFFTTIILMSLNNKSVGLTVYENGSSMSTKQFKSVWDQVVHTAMAQPSFCGIKWLWHFYSPLNGTQVHCRVTASFTYASTMVHLGGERYYMCESKVSCCLARENNAISPGLNPLMPNSDL